MKEETVKIKNHLKDCFKNYPPEVEFDKSELLNKTLEQYKAMYSVMFDDEIEKTSITPELEYFYYCMTDLAPESIEEIFLDIE